MASLWDELKRRNVVRVGIAYAIVAWLLVQIIVSIEEPLNLPSWTDTLVIVLLALGFVVALILAWAYELTPQGVVRTKAVPLPDSVARLTGRRLDFAIIGLLLTAVIVLLLDGNIDRGGVPPAEAPSIAVLPFVDMSPEGDQEYFGDGIAEELLNELVALEGLRVAGRTSSFSFKGSTEDIRSIGEALNVGTILEGSVRKDRDQIRITAQLINVSDGYHIWSETFDRQLEDVFAIQYEIASAVTGALGVRLGVGGVNAFHGAGTAKVDAYEVYLRAMASRGVERIRLLEQATRLDPEYSAAWSKLGLAVAGSQWDATPEEAPALKVRGYELVLRALELDETSAQSHSLHGTMLYSQRDWIRGEAAHRTAMSLRADRDSLSQYGHLLMRSGRLSDAKAQYDKAETAEPVFEGEGFRVYIALAEGRTADAREALLWAPENRRRERELLIHLSARDTDGLAEWLAGGPPASIEMTALFSRIRSVLDSPEAAVSILRDVHADQTALWPSKLHDIAVLAAFFGAPEFALQVVGEEVRFTSVRQGSLWLPVMSDVRRLPGFKELVTDLNLVEFWRASGWADACRPVGENDFECV